MSKFVVAIFPSEAKAYEGTRALDELHAEGCLTVYGSAVLAKDANGQLSVKQAADQGPLAVGVGALAGTLIGLLGGPVGAAIGYGSGAMVGALSDIYNSGVSVDFVNSVSEKLTPGKTAVIAEVAEDWVTPLDTRMEAIGGIVMREWRSDFEDEQIEREVNARKADLAKLKEEFASAAEEQRAKLKAQMDAAQTKLSAVAKRAQGRIDQLQEQAQAQAEIKGMQDQATKANRDTKAKLDRQIAEAQAEYKRRSDKLKQAWQLTKEALAA
jgi:uncharacterized membrane protein